MDDPEGLAEFVRYERSAGRNGPVRLPGGQPAVVVIVVFPTDPLSAVRADQGTLSGAEETLPTHHKSAEHLTHYKPILSL